MSAFQDREKVSLFDADGHYLETISSMPGDSSGLYIRRLVPAIGGNMLAFDAAQRTYSVFATEPTTLKDRRPLPGRFFDAASLRHGSIVISSTIATPNRAGYPLHVLDSLGNVTQSFGADSRGYRSDRSIDRQLASNGSRIWAAMLGQYIIDRWSSAGILEARLTRPADWFVRHDESGVNQERPQPVIEDISWVPGDTLIVLVAVADENWRTAWRDGRLWDHNDLYDTTVEIIDLGRQVVVAHGRFDQYLTDIVTDRLVASYVREADEFYIDLWELGWDLAPTEAF